MLACGVLSLDTSNPPEAFVDAVEHVREIISNGADIPVALDLLRAVFHRDRERHVGVIIGDVDSIVASYSNRGVAESGARFLRDLYATFASRRTEDPFFELRPFWSGNVIDGDLQDLLFNCLPCDALQEFDGDHHTVGRDILVSFGPPLEDRDGWDHSTRLRVIEAQIHFLCTHIATGELDSSGKARPSRCPFFTVCNLPLRIGDPVTCFERPWESATQNPTCWYGAGASATIGTVRNSRI